MVWDGGEQRGRRTHRRHKINLGRQTKPDCEELPSVVTGPSACARKRSGDIRLQWKVMRIRDRTVSPVGAERREGTLELHQLLPEKTSP